VHRRRADWAVTTGTTLLNLFRLMRERLGVVAGQQGLSRIIRVQIFQRDQLDRDDAVVYCTVSPPSLRSSHRKELYLG
jgi:hypothetical protein